MLLAAAGFAHLLTDDSPVDLAVFLVCWNTVAATYLIVGARYLRRHLDRDALDAQAARPTLMRGQRSSFLFTVAASLTGLSAALDVLQGFEGEIAPFIESMAIVHNHLRLDAAARRLRALLRGLGQCE